MSLDRASAAGPGPRTVRQFCVLAAGGGLAGFVAWCATDFLYVRVKPTWIDDVERLLLLFPLVVGLVAAVVLRHLRLGPRITLSIAAPVAASVLALLLIVFLGIPFHFWIGGGL